MMNGKIDDKVLFLKAGRTCWPTFRPTSADQHVGPVCFRHEHVGEEKNEDKMLASISFTLNSKTLSEF